ncbi:ABC transporter permease [Rhodoferax antarcticus]|uniref:ABC transporter permease n=1 Tax=Rhodoferax antarcticus TaxID=81479 RepID=UPI00222411A4|nr:ABC transporter permease [Rhodoferax antarcticus]MCW2313025.1 ABC-2 type transport system permease protein [Rhodoferax antarcticus]
MAFVPALIASLRREAAWLHANPWDLAMISWVPLLAVAMLWWTFSAGLPTRLPIGVMDQDHSALSRQLLRFLDATPGLQPVQSYASTAEATQALRRGEVYGVVSIAPDFAKTLKQGQAAQVTLLHNAQFGLHSSLIQRDVRTAVATLSAGLELTARHKRGESALAAQVAMEPIKTRLVTLFNPALNYEQYLAAALIPAVLHILAMTAGAWTLGRELRDRSLGDWLGPLPGWSHTTGALLGKLFWPLLALGTVATLAMLGLTWGRGWHPQGSVAWVLLALWVFLASSLAMGAFAACASRSLRMALSATGFITAPAFAFGGVGFPLQSMPVLARGWAELLPYTHYVRLQMEQLQMAAPWSNSALALMVIALAAILLIVLCVPLLMRTAKQPASWGGR